MKKGEVMKILWLDTETTGLDSSVHGIREIGYIVEIDGVEREKGVLHLNPFTYYKNIEVSDWVREHSDVDSWKDYPSSEDTMSEFVSVLHRYIDVDDEKDYFILAGYNVKFDIDMIKVWFDDYGYGDYFDNYKGHSGCFHYKNLDVFNFVFGLRYLGKIDTENDRLETICKYFDIDIDAHEALSDIEATRLLFQQISDRFIR